MKIFFVSGNKDKIREARYILARFGIEVKGRIVRFKELEHSDLEEVVTDKAKQIGRIIKEPFIVDDAGIFFEAYPNFPGTFTKYIFNSLEYAGILKLLKDKNRKAYFKTVVAYRENSSRILLFEGVCRGVISPRAKGPFGHFSPFNRLFIPLGCKRTFSQMGLAEQATMSHRAKALEQLAHYLKRKGRKQ